MYPTILETPFFKGMITTEHFEYVQSLFTERLYPKGSVIFFQGDEGTSLYIIKSGTLKIYRQDADREIVFGHQFPGEVIGELEALHYDNHRIASAAAIEKTVLWTIKKSDLDELITMYPEIVRKALYIISERLNQANRKLEYMAFLDTRVRVANLLLDLNSNFGIETENGFLVNWKVTQQHFANMIGVSRESAARALLELQLEGVIQIQNKLFCILNMQVLESLAGLDSPSSNTRKWHSTHRYMI